MGEVKNARSYDVPSHTYPNVTYEVLLGDEYGWCSCPDFYYRVTLPSNHGEDVDARCKHIDQMEPKWSRDLAVAAMSAPRKRVVTITLPAGAGIEVS